MGAIADLAVPQGGAIAALPNPTPAIQPEQLDVENFNATAGPVRQGLRSGFNSLGASMNALIGQTGETLGLTEFANDRFKDAANYADFADRVGAPVRDWGQVKDAEQLSKFVAGMTGEALATSLPAAGAALALRRPVAGITAGTLPFSAGSHIQQLRNDPNVKASPREILTSGLEKGAIDSALFASLGAEGQAARKVLAPKTATGGLGKALVEGAAGNAAVGAASDVAGQTLHKDLNPEKEMNWDETLNAAISNAVPGAIISGAGHAVAALPGAAARSTDELRARLGKKKAPPADEPSLDDLKPDMSVQDVANLLGDREQELKDYTDGVWNKVKNHPAAQKFGDVLTDPDAREAFTQEVRQKYSDSEYKPKVDAAISTGKKWLAGAQKWMESKRAEGEKIGDAMLAKKSEMRTKVDTDIDDAMIRAMPPDHLEAATPSQLKELSGIIKKMAQNADYFTETSVPQGLRKAFGAEFKPLMEYAIDRVHAEGPARTAAKEKLEAAFKTHEDMEGKQIEEVQNLVRTHLKDEYLMRPDMRDAAMEELAPKLLDYVQHEGITEPFGVKEDGNSEFHAAMKEAFGDKTDDVMATLDRMNGEAKAHHVFESGGEEAGPAGDARLDKKYTDVVEARKVRDELVEQYGRKNVNIDMRQNEDGTIGLHLESADHMGLDGPAFSRAREPAKYNRSGLENGVLTVRTDKAPQGVKVNLINLTNEMIRREGNLLQDTGPKYIADMFKRGVAALMATEGFRGFRTELENGTFPDNTPVAHLRGKTYTFGEIKEAGKLSKWDIAGFTKEELADQKAKIAAQREARGWMPLDPASLQRAGVNAMIAKVRSEEMAKTLADRMDQRKEAVSFEAGDGTRSTLEKKVGGKGEDEQFKDVMRNKPEDDDLVTEAQPSMRERDPKDKNGEMIPRTYEEETGGPIGSGGTAATKSGPESTPPTPPHGQGPKSPAGMKKADLTTKVMDALNMSNPKVREAAEKLRPKKYSLMDNGRPKWEKVPDKEGLFGTIPAHEEMTMRSGLRVKVHYQDGLWHIKDAASGEKYVMDDRPYDFEGYKTEAEAKAAVEKGHPNFSTMNIGKGEQTPEMQAEVKEYVKKVLGTNRTKVLFEKLDHAGEFAKLNGVETLKISIDASDPMSVGHHEAVHAFIGRLMNADPKAAHTLMRAASAAPVVARLRELLKGHPEALKQLSDPEERIAYMYQFWAAGHKGLFSVGPNTRTFFERVKGFFSKLQAIWADDMGQSIAAERANELITAFHNGEFANRSTVAQVLAKRFPPDPEASLRKFWPGLGKFMDHVIYTANGTVRDMNIPALTEVMDKFHTLASEAGQPAGFNQVRRVVYNKYLNRVIDVIKDMDDAQQAALVEELQSGNKRTSEGAKAIEQLNKDLFKYMESKGVKTWDGKDYVPLKEIKENYWHRTPNQEYLRTPEGKAEFLAMLDRNGIKDGDGIYDKWTRDIDSGDPQEGDAVLGLSFYTPQINERKLQNIPDSEMAPFLDKDLFGTMSTYIQRAVRRAEYTERFGNRGEVIDAARKQAEVQGATPEQLKVFEASVKAHEGTLGSDMNPKLRSTYAALMTYQNIRLLPLQLFSSFVDPLGIVVRGGTLGDAFKGFTRGLRELVGAKKDDAYDMAATIGSISTAFDQGLASDMVNAQFMPKLTKAINEKFFKYNGMESWNRSLRIAATKAAHDFIVRHATQPNEHSERMLSELNLKKKDVKVVDGQLDLNNEKIQAAMNQWVNESILTPNPAHRPIYMSDPHYMLISHLKQYSYLFQKVILSRVHNELKNGNYSPAIALAGYVPAIIAADMMRIAITPTPADDAARAGWTAKDWLWSGIQRAGFFGPGQMAVGTAMDARQDRIPGQNLFGPSIEQMVDIVRDAAQGTGLKNELVNAVPGLKLVKGTGRETTPVGDE